MIRKSNKALERSCVLLENLPIDLLDTSEHPATKFCAYIAKQFHGRIDGELQVTRKLDAPNAVIERNSICQFLVGDSLSVQVKCTRSTINICKFMI